MQVDSQIWSGNGSIPATSLANPQLVLALGERALLADASAELVEMHPGAFVVAASTASTHFGGAGKFFDMPLTMLRANWK